MHLDLISVDNSVIHLQCTGQITQYEVQGKDNPMESLLGPECFSRTVLLNLEKTSYIDSSGVGWLLGCHKNFLQSGGKLVLHSVPPMVLQVLQLLRMHMILHIAADPTAARSLAVGEKA